MTGEVLPVVHIAVGGGVIGVIFILAKFLLGGGDVSQLQQDLQQQQPQQQEMTAEQKAADDREASFVKVVLADTEDVWTKIFGIWAKPTANQHWSFFEMLQHLVVEMPARQAARFIARLTRMFILTSHSPRTSINGSMLPRVLLWPMCCPRSRASCSYLLGTVTKNGQDPATG
jgi:hypothetical protein